MTKHPVSSYHLATKDVAAQQSEREIVAQCWEHLLVLRYTRNAAFERIIRCREMIERSYDLLQLANEIGSRFPVIDPQ
jgi:hypothetical protein